MVLRELITVWYAWAMSQASWRSCLRPTPGDCGGGRGSARQREQAERRRAGRRGSGLAGGPAREPRARGQGDGHWMGQEGGAR